MGKVKKDRELKAYAIGDNRSYGVVISPSKDIAWYWLRDVRGETNEQMSKFRIWEFPLDQKVLIKHYKEVSAAEVIEEMKSQSWYRGFPIVSFEKKSHEDYFTNWHTDWYENQNTNLND